MNGIKKLWIILAILLLTIFIINIYKDYFINVENKHFNVHISDKYYHQNIMEIINTKTNIEVNNNLYILLFVVVRVLKFVAFMLYLSISYISIKKRDEITTELVFVFGFIMFIILP